ncbi:MAG: hypothetical protein FWG59_05065 [Betaproteobacteria bacterium]|nr:hypothetical protein [Betaproteobacteria bacterium]
MGEERIQVGCLGYQDIILSTAQARALLGAEGYMRSLTRWDVYSSAKRKNRKLAFLPTLEAKAIFADPKAREKLKIDKLPSLLRALQQDVFIYETQNIFAGFGCEYSAIDVIAHTGTEKIHDLNYPITDNLRDVFDIVVDGGTMEHCFNVPEVLFNIVKMLKLNGFILHISPITYPNHGYYNFNPVLFHEFYTHNGCKTISCTCAVVYSEDQPKTIPLSDTFELPLQNTVMFFIAQKIIATNSIGFPLQGIYR